VNGERFTAGLGKLLYPEAGRSLITANRSRYASARRAASARYSCAGSGSIVSAFTGTCTSSR
jgi:hypothetical protein